MNEFSRRLAHVFPRPATRTQSGRYISALLHRVERKDSWQLAESLGDETPYRLQSLLGRSSWDADKAVVALQEMVRERCQKPTGTFILDDTGFVKKGDKSVGVQSRYFGRTGKIDSCQTGIFLAFESGVSTFLIDRPLYRPRSWVGAKRRRAEASVPESIEYQSKADLRAEMVKSTLGHGLEADWVLGDSIYGKDPGLRKFLADRRIRYILGVQGNVRWWRNLVQWKLSKIATEVPMRWTVQSCGKGTQKDRTFRWAVYDFPKAGCPAGWKSGVLFRQSLQDPTDLTYSRLFAPDHSSKKTLVHAAGRRWKVEESFQRAKGEVGLAEYEVRSWHGWHRHTALAMWAHALLGLLDTKLKKFGSL